MSTRRNGSTAERIEFDYALQRDKFSLDVQASLPMRGITGLFGPSGCGKTTLLRCIAGLEPAARGRLAVGADVWEDTKQRMSLSVERRRIAYVFQEPRLFSHLDVSGNLAYARKRRPAAATGIDEDHIIDLLGIGALRARRVDELSGGEAQRVAIARALLTAPRLVLMDEPLASLDAARKDEVLPFLDRLHAELAVPIVYVSHSIEEVCRLSDHLVLMDGGRIVANDVLQKVLTDTTVEALQGVEAGSVLETRCEGYHEDDELTRLRFSGGEFLVPGKVGVPGGELRLRIRAADVSLCRERPTQSSILNIFPAQVASVDAVGEGMTLIRLKLAEDTLLARVTRRSVRDLEVTVGDSLFVQIKSASIRNVPSVGSAEPTPIADA